MTRFAMLVPAVLALLAACTTPYNSPVVVHDSTPFPGIGAIVAQDTARPVDVVVVHGMCTRDNSWAAGVMDNLTQTIRTSTEKQARQPAAGPAQIQVIERTDHAAGGTVHYHTIMWSPMVAALKQQLVYDATGTPTDCSKEGECKPKRAHFNAQAKDQLLNDCLADAAIYSGQSQPVFRHTMVATVTKVLQEAEHATNGEPGPLVVVAESLGSKILFDALADMLDPAAPPQLRELGQRAAHRMSIVFMIGNQLPLLGLADQRIDAAANAPRAQDALQRFLALRRLDAPAPKNQALNKLAVVAFTDPNDLLSYRLMPSRYAAPDVLIADVLVSNSPTWFGLLENPFAAHMNYLQNRDVGGIIACGWPRSALCR